MTTTHRASSESICGLALLLLVLGFVVRTANAQEKLTAQEIIKRHYAALGSPVALGKVKSRVAIGTVQREEEPAAKFYLMSEPGRISAFYSFRDYDLQMLFDGNSATVRPLLFRNSASPVQRMYEQILASGLMFNDMSLNDLITKPDADLKIEAKGTKKIAGRPAYVVQLKRKNDTLNLYFDTETFMWVRTDFGKVHISAPVRNVSGSTAALNQNEEEGGSESVIDFYIETSDFREVNGIKLPFKFTQVVTAPILRKAAVGTITGTINEYRDNEPIDPKMFK